MKEGSSSLGQLRIGNCKGYSGNWTGVLLGRTAMMTMMTTMMMRRLRMIFMLTNLILLE